MCANSSTAPCYSHITRDSGLDYSFKSILSPAFVLTEVTQLCLNILILILKKLTGDNWDTVYIHVMVQGYKLKDMPDQNVVWGSYLNSIGYSNRRGRYRDSERDGVMGELNEMMNKANSDIERQTIAKIMDRIR